MARSPQHSFRSSDNTAPTKDSYPSADISLVLYPAADYTGLLQPANPFSAFQVFPPDSLYTFPILCGDEDARTQEETKFVQTESIDIKASLQHLQEDSPFKRGIAEVFPDAPSPSSPTKRLEISINSESRAAPDDSVSCYEDPLHMSRDLFRDSLPRYSETSEQPSRNEISMTTREVLHNIQRDFAARQNELHLHSITPESSFFKDSRGSMESFEFNPSGRESLQPKFEIEGSFTSFKGTEMMISGDDSLLELDLRPSLYRKSRTSDLFGDNEEGSMSMVDEGTAFRPPIFHTGPAFSRNGTTQMPEILEEDSSSGYTPHSQIISEHQLSVQGEEVNLSLPASDKAGGSRPPLPMPVFIPEKVLMRSMTPTSFATFADISTTSSREAYSPIISKLAVFVPKGHNEYELQAAWPLCGFSGAPSLEFSNVAKRSKGTLSSVLSKLPAVFGLFSESILRPLLTYDILWVTCGFEHAAVLTRAGRVHTWGYGASGVLGHGDTNSVAYPKLVETLTETTVIHLESGAFHSVAVATNGALWTWGRGEMYQLGHSKSLMFKDEIGNVVLKPQPVSYFSSNSIAVKGAACGEAHTLVLDSDGKVYAFGWGAYGQLGLGTWDPKQKGVEKVKKIKALAETKVISIACGLLFSACVTDMGQVWVWGHGESGQLGLGGSVKQSLTPVCVTSLLKDNVIDIVCGESHAMALTRSGTVYAWGTGVAGVFSNTEAFNEGAEIVCYVPQQLARLESVCRLSTTEGRPLKVKQDSLATGLMAKLREYQAQQHSVDSSM